MSDSEVDISGLQEDREVPDDSICPACKKSTYVGETISCETCLCWFHFECVGVSHNDDCVKSEDVPYFCPPCSGRGPKFSPIPKSVKKQTPAKKRRKEPIAKAPKEVQVKTPKEVQVKAPKESVKKAVQSKHIPLEGQSILSNQLTKSPPVKLKLAFQSKRCQSVTFTSEEMLQQITPSTPQVGDTSRRKRNDSEEEEEKWLDAVESGNLHKVDEELKRIRDPKLMTARQRAMITKKSEPGTPQVTGSPQSPSIPTTLFLNTPVNLDESGHLSLDYGGKKKTALDELDLEQKAIKSQKRKEIELEKREHDKKKTMDRLLLKKESKFAKSDKSTFERIQRSGNIPKWSYRLTPNGATISLPKGSEFPISPQKAIDPLPATKCVVSDCINVKKYNCSKTGKPVCSLKCYQKNLTLVASAS